MEIRVYYCFIVFNCFIILPSLVAKTFSLNEAIAAEAKTQAPIKLPRLSDISKLQPANTSLLKNRKTFLIKPPIWPKILKRPQYRPRLKTPSQVKQTKRELDNDDEINRKYIPLFRSLSVILDNIISADSGEYNLPRNKFKRHPISTHDANDIVCNCAYRSTTESHLSSSNEEAIIPAVVSNEVETGTSTPTPPNTPKTDRAPNNNIRDFRRNKNIPILPTRNTSSFRRNTYGFNERRGTSHIRNTQGTFAGNNGNNEHNTRNRIIEPLTEDSKEHTDSNTRDCSSCHESSGTETSGEYTRNANGKRNENDELVYAPISSLEGNIFQHEGQNQFTNRGVETKGAELLPEHTPRLQGMESENKREITQAKEKDYAAIEHYITSAKRVSNRNSTNPTENKKHRGTNEAIAPHSLQLQSPNNKVVMIFDGYSVARDVNGENKMSEKAFEIRN